MLPFLNEMVRIIASGLGCRTHNIADHILFLGVVTVSCTIKNRMLIRLLIWNRFLKDLEDAQRMIRSSSNLVWIMNRWLRKTVTCANIIAISSRVYFKHLVMLDMKNLKLGFDGFLIQCNLFSEPYCWRASSTVGGPYEHEPSVIQQGCIWLCCWSARMLISFTEQCSGICWLNVTYKVIFRYSKGKLYLWEWVVKAECRN